MRLVRVVGQVVATRKDAGLAGARLLLVQPVDRELQPSGRTQVALDGLQSREGELVVVVTAREASFAVPGKVVPSDCSIVGKVDAVSA
jgi:ethanolamine utilization protein EutN